MASLLDFLEQLEKDVQDVRSDVGTLTTRMQLITGDVTQFRHCLQTQLAAESTTKEKENPNSVDLFDGTGRILSLGSSDEDSE